MPYDYQRIRTRNEHGVLYVTIDNPPANVMTMELYFELTQITREAEADPDVRVIVFQSANQDFFIAHFDVSALLQFPIDQPARQTATRDVAGTPRDLGRGRSSARCSRPPHRHQRPRDRSGATP